MRSSSRICACFNWTRKFSLQDAFFASSPAGWFQVMLLLMVMPSYFVLTTDSIGIQSISALGRCELLWLKVMVTSFVLSPFIWNRFFFDQSITWSTASSALLHRPLSIHSETVMSSMYFHSLKTLDILEIVNHEQKQLGTKLGPLGHSRRDFSPLRQTIFAELFSLWSEEITNPIDDAMGYNYLAVTAFVGQGAIDKKIKCLSVIKEKQSNSWSIAVSHFKSFPHHAYEP